MEYLNKFLNCKDVVVCQNTLSLLDPGRFDFAEYIDKQLYLHAFSKFRYTIDADIIHEQDNSNGIMTITPIYHQCIIRLKNDKEKNKFQEYTIFPHDVLVFPSHLFIDATPDNADIIKKIFKIGPVVKNGDGNNKFRLSLQLIDTYEIDVYADSESDAIDIGFNLGLGKWEHMWELGDENSIPQTSRVSLWNKKMIKVKK